MKILFSVLLMTIARTASAQTATTAKGQDDITIYLIGFLLYILIWIIYWVIRHLVRFSIDLEGDMAGARVGNAKFSSFERLGVLRALDAMGLTIFSALMPVASIVLGMIMPAKVRGYLEAYVSPGALIGVTLAALFAYGAIFMVWKRHEGPLFLEALKRMFRPSDSASDKRSAGSDGHTNNTPARRMRAKGAAKAT